MGDDRPLIVTAELDAGTFAWLDALRREHFPVARNHLGAHLTLFHALPGDAVARVRGDLAAAAATTSPLRGRAVRWVLLGRGVAMAVEAPELVALRARLAAGWPDLLGGQDAQPFRRPHVTVQNKVAPSDARRLHARLAADHAPRPLELPALRLWRYDGGPWEHEARFALGSAARAGVGGGT